MDATLIAVLLITFAVIVGGIGLLVMLGLVGFMFFRRGGSAEDEDSPGESTAIPEDAAATEEAPRTEPAPPSPAPISSTVPDPGSATIDRPSQPSDFQDEGGATEVFNKADHGRLMGWDQEEEAEEEDAGATELFTKEQLAAQYADLMDDDDDDGPGYGIDDDDDGPPGKVVAE